VAQHHGLRRQHGAEDVATARSGAAKVHEELSRSLTARPGILKPGIVKDRRRLFLDDLRSAARRSNFGTDLAALLGHCDDSARGATPLLPETECVIVVDDADGSRPTTTDSGPPRLVVAEDFDAFRASSPLEISSALLADKNLSDAKRRSASFAGKLDGGDLTSPGVAPPRAPPARARGHSFRRLTGIDAIVPTGVSLPEIPQVTATAAGWQQVQSEKRGTGLTGEVSLRGADASMLEQYQQEVLLFKADRERWQQERRKQANAKTKFSNVADDEVRRHLQRGRLDKGTEKKEVQAGASVGVDFQATTWNRKKTKLASLVSVLGSGRPRET